MNILNNRKNIYFSNKFLNYSKYAAIFEALYYIKNNDYKL